MNAWCGSASRGVKKSGRLRHRLSVLILLLSASLFVFSGCTDSRKTDAAYRACMEEMNHIIAEAPLSDDVGAEAFGGAKINQIVIMKAGSEITDEITITGYFLEQKYPNYSGIVQMAKMFVDEHPHVKIIFDNYEDDTAYTEAYPVMLMSENYGDIVLLPYHTKMSYLQESKFVDLMKYIEDEAKFSPDKYFMNLVLAERNVNGALLAFPTRFFSEAEFIFLKPLSEEFAARFENDPDLTIRDLLDFYLAKKEEMGPNWDMHFHEYFNPVWLITFNFNSLVDFKNKKANFTDPDFMELMEKVKNNVLVDQYYYTEDGLQNKIFYGGTVDDFATISNAQSTQMLESVYLNYTVLLPTNNRVRTKPRVISNFAGKYQFGAHGRFAISRKSKNPDLAWRFIEYIASEKEIAPYDPASLTSYKERLEEYTSLFSYSYPINKANFRKFFEVSLDFEDKRIRRAYESQLTCSWEEYRKMVMDYYFSAAEKLNDSTLWSGEFFQPYTRGIIWDEMYLYLNDLQSVEQTMQNIENKIQIMLNE